MPTSLSLLRAATPALRLPARPLAPRSLTVTPAGRARRLAKPARVPPRPPLGPPRPALSARCAPRSPHLRQLAIFTPPSGPAWAPDSVLSN